MDSAIRKQSNQLKIKAEQVECPKHKKPTLALNISQNELLGNRISCEDCPTFNKRLLYLNKVEQLLFEWFDSQTQEIETKKVEFQLEIELLQRTIEQVQKKMLMLIQTLSTRVKNLSELQNQQMNRQYLNEIKYYLTAITSEGSLNITILQNLAEFISKQSIQNDKIELKKQLNFNNTFSGISVIQKKLENICNLGLQSNQKSILNANDLQFTVKVNQNSKEIHSQLTYSTKQEKISQELGTLIMYKDPIDLQNHQVKITAVAISQNNKLMASGDNNGVVILWDLLQRKLINNYQGDIGLWIPYLSFSKDDQFLAVAQGGYYKACDILLFKLNSDSLSPSIRLKGHTNTLSKLVFANNSKYLLSGSFDRTFQIWNIQLQKQISSRQFSDPLHGISISQNQQIIACGCSNGQAYLFNSANFLKIQELVQWKVDRWIGCITFTPDSKKLIISNVKCINLWNINSLLQDKNYLPTKVFMDEEASASLTVRVLLNGQVLMNHDGQIKFWNIETGQLLHRLIVKNVSFCYQTQQGTAKLFATTSDMKYIVTVGDDSKLIIFERIE